MEEWIRKLSLNFLFSFLLSLSLESAHGPERPLTGPIPSSSIHSEDSARAWPLMPSWIHIWSSGRKTEFNVEEPHIFPYPYVFLHHFFKMYRVPVSQTQNRIVSWPAYILELQLHGPPLYICLIPHSRLLPLFPWCWHSFQLFWLVFISIDRIHNQLERGNLNRRIVYIKLACGHACDMLSWMKIDV